MTISSNSSQVAYFSMEMALDPSAPTSAGAKSGANRKLQQDSGRARQPGGEFPLLLF
jgi:hypothetical protein